ncbi:GNAT family N-acetyltransferase [Pontibacter sp. 13R65]|uniref:GNAT family N-acetyltransferase n=1 Tax=Pontibacter sp. 13R65 TaxID=3127458 RepID=UPI00301BE5B0
MGVIAKASVPALLASQKVVLLFQCHGNEAVAATFVIMPDTTMPAAPGSAVAYQIKEILGLEAMLEQHHLIEQLNPTMSRSRYEDLLQQMLPNGYRMVGVFVAGRCVGLSGFWVNAKLYSGKYLEVDNFVVEAAHRSCGLGKALSDWLEQEARLHLCDTIMLDAYVTNSAAHKFYFREGYHIKSYHFFKTLQ